MTFKGKKQDRSPSGIWERKKVLDANGQEIIKSIVAYADDQAHAIRRWQALEQSFGIGLFSHGKSSGRYVVWHHHHDWTVLSKLAIWERFAETIS
jgi:hypothetical protein